MTNIYEDGRYLAANPNWHSEDSAWKAQLVREILQRNAVNALSICEVGCGAGQVIGNLASTFPAHIKFHGFEISSQAFEICRRSERTNLRFEHGNLLDETNRHFDVVLAIDVIEHVEDCFGFLRGLRERGTFKVYHIPLDLSVQSVLRPNRLMHARTHIGHIHYFTRETAFATLTDTGHQIVDWSFTCGALELPVESLGSRLLNGPRRLISWFSDDLAARLLGGFSLLVLAK